MPELSPDLALYLGQTYQRARNEHSRILGAAVRQYQYESNLYKYDMIDKFGEAAGKYTTQIDDNFAAEEARVKREHDEAIRLAEEDARIAAGGASRLAEEAARIALGESNMEKVKAAFKPNKRSYSIYNTTGAIITRSNIEDRRAKLIRAGGGVELMLPVQGGFGRGWLIAKDHPGGDMAHYLYGYRAIKFGIVSLLQISAGQNDAAAAELTGKVEEPVVVDEPVVADVIDVIDVLVITTTIAGNPIYIGPSDLSGNAYNSKVNQGWLNNSSIEEMEQAIKLEIDELALRDQRGEPSSTLASRKLKDWKYARSSLIARIEVLQINLAATGGYTPVRTYALPDKRVNWYNWELLWPIELILGDNCTKQPLGLTLIAHKFLQAQPRAQILLVVDIRGF